jgi:CRP/FNR family transcriptional regulator, cyclic AMP receptor protein
MNLPWHEYVGYGGVALALASMSRRTIIPLRLFAIGACTAFAIYCAASGAYPNLVVNLIALPVHAYRLWEMLRLTRHIRVAVDSDLNVDWLKPFMRQRKIASGTPLFRKGDHAAEMYYVVSGRLRLVELNLEIGPGQLVGEIGLFSPARSRTFGATAVEDVELLAIGDRDLQQLYYQNPRFGFYLIQLVTRRLVVNMERLEAQASITGQPA